MILRPDAQLARDLAAVDSPGRELRLDLEVARCRWRPWPFQVGIGGTHTTRGKTVDVALVRPVCRVADLTSNSFSFIFRRGR